MASQNWIRRRISHSHGLRTLRGWQWRKWTMQLWPKWAAIIYAWFKMVLQNTNISHKWSLLFPYWRVSVALQPPWYTFRCLSQPLSSFRWKIPIFVYATHLFKLCFPSRTINETTIICSSPQPTEIDRLNARSVPNSIWYFSFGFRSLNL